MMIGSCSRFADLGVVSVYRIDAQVRIRMCRMFVSQIAGGWLVIHCGFRARLQLLVVFMGSNVAASAVT